MPITPFLKAFDPELLEAMGTAFVSTCTRALGLTERTDAITTPVAEKIIELKSGPETPLNAVN